MWQRRRHKKELSAAIAHSRQLLAEKRHKENLKYLEEGVAETFPEDPEIRLLYGTVLLEANPTVGLSEISKSVELDPDEPIRLTRAARIMYTMGQLDHARRYTERAREIAPADFVFGPELLNLESNLGALDGEDELAEEGLRLAVEQDPKMEILALDLALFLRDRGRRAEALSVIDEALGRSKDTNYLRRLRSDLLADGDSE